MNLNARSGAWFRPDKPRRITASHAGVHPVAPPPHSPSATLQPPYGRGLYQDAPTRSTSDDISWRLADELPAGLPSRTKHAIYVKLGCRQYLQAVREILQAVIALELSLPETLIGDVKTWIETFDGDDESQGIRDLLDKTRRCTDEPGSLTKPPSTHAHY